MRLSPRSIWIASLAVGLRLAVAPGTAASPYMIQVDPNRPESLLESILDAYHSGKRQIAIPAGTYTIPPSPQGPHLLLQGLSNFVIDARGVTLVFTDQHRIGVE